MGESFKMRTPCAQCGHEYGAIVVSGPHHRVNCLACGKYNYFAPQRNVASAAPPRDPSVMEIKMIERLVQRVDRGDLQNDFINSVLEQYHRNGKLTQKQWDALRKWDR